MGCLAKMDYVVDSDARGLIHVIDDEDSVCRSLDFLLRTAGYRVTCWGSGDAFVAGLDRQAPAGGLLDFLMPGLGGLDVQDRLAMQGIDMPVIMMSGSNDPAVTLQAIMAGAVDLIEKPFDRTRLLKAINNGFDRLAARTTMREERDRAGSQIARLSQRERQVLDGLACGFATGAIAQDLGVSSNRVEVCRATAMAKLQVTYFADALRIALTGGLGTPTGWRGRRQCWLRPLPDAPHQAILPALESLRHTST